MEKEKYDKHLEEIKTHLRGLAEEVKESFTFWLDWDEDYYYLVTTWIIGAMMHDKFDAFPHLFFNATKGSGKSRALRLIAYLTGGELIGVPTESVLYRYPKNKVLCLDECESIGGKDKQALREILNSSYKKGLKIMRNRKIKTPAGEDYVIDGFEPYKPIAIANIWGMDEVLGDRSIKIILDKSSSYRTKLIEDFENCTTLNDLKVRLNEFKCSLCSVVTLQGNVKRWNNYIISINKTTLNNTILLASNTALTSPEQFLNELTADEDIFFNTLVQTKLDGRNLELFFPLFQVAKLIGDDWVGKLIEISKKYVTNKKSEETAMSRDVLIMDFISRQLWSATQWYSIKDITFQFREFVGEDEEEDRWINTKSVGRALNRLNLIISKRRLSKGMEILVNCEKARFQMKMYREDLK